MNAQGQRNVEKDGSVNTDSIHSNTQRKANKDNVALDENLDTLSYKQVGDGRSNEVNEDGTVSGLDDAIVSQQIAGATGGEGAEVKEPHPDHSERNVNGGNHSHQPSAKVNPEAVKEFEIEATVSPEKLKTNSIRPNSSTIRKRRHDLALEYPDVANTFAGDAHNDGVLPDCNDGNNDTDESGVAIKKLLKEIVKAAESRKRRSIQETGSSPSSDDIAATRADDEQDTSPVEDTPVTDHSISEDGSESTSNNNNEDSRDTARKSCEFMGYKADEIDEAINRYSQLNDGADDFHAIDLAELIDDKRNDEVPDASSDPGPIASKNDYVGDSQDHGIMNMDSKEVKYSAIAIVIVKKDPSDVSVAHTTVLTCPCGCGKVFKSHYP